ncbi:MAG: PIN domain-containing protein, partial [Pyrinomonadaceae bacterium]
MRVYLDNCVFNRPFDDQQQSRIKLETKAVLEIRRRVEIADIELVWSYIIDVENSRNPLAARRESIDSWRNLALIEVEPSIKIVSLSLELRNLGLDDLDSLHIACAIEAKSGYFITTDDGIL